MQHQYQYLLSSAKTALEYEHVPAETDRRTPGKQANEVTIYKQKLINKIKQNNI